MQEDNEWIISSDSSYHARIKLFQWSDSQGWAVSKKCASDTLKTPNPPLYALLWY